MLIAIIFQESRDFTTARSRLEIFSVRNYNIFVNCDSAMIKSLAQTHKFVHYRGWEIELMNVFSPSNLNSFHSHASAPKNERGSQSLSRRPLKSLIV